ncbi:hypothetical protein MMC14_003806 [Varicellaria rhodocarpa]|nr:hypothetical protein [Varicellaria rhodocarpa]
MSVALGLFYMVKFGVENEWLERLYPSPHEWSWISRWLLRSNHGQVNGFQNENGLVDWGNVSSSWRNLVYRLEHPDFDGKGLPPRLEQERGLGVEDVSKTGLDISSMSEPWRRGYYEALFGSARAAEHLDTWVLDRTRHIAFPPEVVLGPSNPRPKPVPFGTCSAPLEENCEPADKSPKEYYMKILTTRGFSTRQRLDAALAFADWLDFKGRTSSAEDIYDWALDIAMGGLPIGVNNVVDTKTGVINEHATYISPNILQATKSLAFHHAQNNNISTALPIFLSVLRAQRDLLPTIKSDNAQLDPTTTSSATSSISSFIISMFKPPIYPPEPLSGDEPVKRTPATACEDAAIMAHIGEILFSFSYQKPSPSLGSSALIMSSLSSYLFPTQSPDEEPPGLSWTRSSVSLAESTLRSLTSSRQKTVNEATQERCAECLLMGMHNWQTMLTMLRKEEQRERKKLKELSVKGEKGKQPDSGGGWFWSQRSKVRGSEMEMEGEEEGKWEREERLIMDRGRQVRRFLREEGLGKNSGL